MRIKQDFVTNSSSTSFILHGKVYGRMSRVDDLNKVSENLNADSTKGGDNWKVIIMDIKDPTNNGDSGEVRVSITNSYIFPETEKEKEIPCSFLEIALKTYLITHRQGKESPIKELTKKILEEILKTIPKKDLKNSTGEFSYLQFPELFGDGWDTGDPMGEYSFSMDCFLNETAVGKISLENGKLYIKWKNQDLEIEM